MRFKIKPNIDIDKCRLLELFFKDWIDTLCENDVQYNIEQIDNTNDSIFKVDFNNSEDAVALRLKGVPEEFQPYLEIIN